MRTLDLVTGFLLIVAIFGSISLIPVVEANREHDAPRTYSATVKISGLPRSMSTTVYLDGHQWGRYRGGLTLNFYFQVGSAHTISVDRIVNASSSVTYVCELNTATFSKNEPLYSFNYTLFT
jgi:hypothetical protein